MTPAASILLVLRERAAARATLEALWSEDPGVPVEVVAHAEGPALEVVRREHARRVRLAGGCAGLTPGAVLDELLEGARARTLVLLAEGARPTPGWVRELVAALDVGPAVAAPMLPPSAAPPGPQRLPGAPAHPGPTRQELRALSTTCRFDEPRFLPVEELSTACVALPRRVLERVGLFDARYAALAGAVEDVLRRARAAGATPVVARRAFVWAVAAPLAPADAQALARAASADPAGPCPPVALELESDDVDGVLLRRLANGLFERGVPLRTFSRGWRPDDRPTRAPHVVARALASATRGARLVLLRTARDVAPPPARSLRLELPGPRRAPPDDPLPVLALPACPGPPPERLDAWTRAVRAAARATEVTP